MLQQPTPQQSSGVVNLSGRANNQSSNQSVPMGINNPNNTSLIQSDPPTRYSTSPNQFDQYMKKKKRVFNHEKYFIVESLAGKDPKTTTIPNYSKILFVNDFAGNFAKVQHLLPDEIVARILSFISFPLGTYMKRIFHQNNRQFVYDYNQLVNESKNDTKNLIPDFMKENITLIQTWRDITKLLYGKRVIGGSSSSDSMDCSDDEVKHTGSPFRLWSNLDCAIQSCYEYDQELPLNTKQIRAVLLCFSQILGFDFSGNTSFNNRCLKYLIQRNPKLETLNLKVTRVDYDGLVHLLNKSDNNTLRELKLTRTLLRSSIPVDFYGKLKALRSLDIVNHQLKDSDVVKIIQSRPFTHLNLSGSSIPIEIVNVKTLTSLILEDCGLSAEIAKTIIEKLDRLKSLDLSKNNGLTPEVFDNTAKNENLLQLRLAGTDVSDDVIKNITKSGSLTLLDLDSTKITTKGVKTVVEGNIIKSLTCLSIRNCGITPQTAKTEFPNNTKILKL